jgi:hypothetical protein
MTNRMNQLFVSATDALCSKLYSLSYLNRLERGDADSGGSTLRTLGVVTMIVIVVALIGAAILFKGNETASFIAAVDYNW